MPIFDDNNNFPDPNAVVASQLANDVGASAPVDPQSVVSAGLRQNVQDPGWADREAQRILGSGRPGSFDPSKYLSSDSDNKISADEITQYLGPADDTSATKKPDDSGEVSSAPTTAVEAVGSTVLSTPAKMAAGIVRGVNNKSQQMVETAGGEGSPLSVDDLPGGANAPAPEPVEQNPVLGPAVKGAETAADYIEKKVGPNEASRKAHPIAAAFGGGVGAILPTVAAGMVNPGLGIAAGMAEFGPSAYEDEFKQAKAKGATDEQADESASLSGLASYMLGGLPVASVFGKIPVGKVLAPFAKYTGPVADWLNPALSARSPMSTIIRRAVSKAAEDGIVFTGVGEAQQAIASEVAKAVYDPNGGYDFDTKRMLGEFLTGALIGAGMHTYGDIHDIKTSGKAASDLVDTSNKSKQYDDDQNKQWQEAEEERRRRQPPPPPGEEDVDPIDPPPPPPPPPPGDEGTGAKFDPTARSKAWSDAWSQTPGQSDENNRAWRILATQMVGQGNSPWTNIKKQNNRSKFTGNGYGFKPEDLKGASLGDLQNFQANADMLQSAGYTPEHISRMAPGDMAAAVLDLQMKRGGAQQQAGAQPGAQAQPPGADAQAQATPEEEAGAQPGTSSSPIDLQTGADVARAAAVASTDHSHAQGEAGNRQSGHAVWNGLGVKFEVAAGGTRKGTVPDTGAPWETTHPHAYGEFKDLPPAADGMKPDVIVGDHPNAPSVYVIDEIDPQTGKYRQSKSFVGFQTPAEVAQSYAGISSKSMAGIGGMRAFGRDEFVKFAKDGGLSKPVTDLKAKSDDGTKGEQPKPQAIYEGMDLVQRDDPTRKWKVAEIYPERNIVVLKDERGARLSKNIKDLTGQMEAPGSPWARREQPKPASEPGMAADTPSAEPLSDIQAQARDLADKKNRRGALWLPKDTVDHLSKLGKLDEVIGAHPAQHNFDGKGGILVARDLGTIAQAKKDKKAGRSIQEIVGRLVGAGSGKPADATHVVQQLDEQGNVTRERAVRESDVKRTYQAFSTPGRSVRIVSPEEAVKRRADLVSREAGIEQPAPEPRESSPHDHHAVAEELKQAGIDPAQVRPADIARAGEIHAEEGLAPLDAFPVAVLRHLVETGAVSREAVQGILGHERTAKLLDAINGDRGRRPARLEDASAAARRPAAEAQSGVSAGGDNQNAEAAASQSDEHGQAGETVSTAGAEADGRERSVPDAGDKAAGRDELSAAGGKQHAEPAGASGAAGEPAGTKQGSANGKAPAAAKNLNRKPASVLEYIAHRGGLKPSPEWEGMGLTFRSNVIVPNVGRRSLIKRDGMQVDRLIEALREGGYIEKAAEGRPDDAGVMNHVYDLVEKDWTAHQNNDDSGKQYAIGVEPPTSSAEQHRIDESWDEHEARTEEARGRLHSALDEAGIPIHSVRPDLEERAVRLMLDSEDAGEDLDPADLLERAALSLARDEDEIRENDLREIGVDDEVIHGLDEITATEAGREAAPERDGKELAGAEEEKRDEGRGPVRSDGESAGQEPGAAATERTEAGEQGVLPGAERIGQGEHAQRKADERLKPKKAQKPADEGLFGDSSKQTDLVDMAKKPLGPVERHELIQAEAERQYPGTSETNKKGKVTKYVSHERIAFENGANGYDWDAGMPIHRTEAEMSEAYEAGKKFGKELDGASHADVPAADSDETVHVTLTDKGPWDFNDTFPRPNREKVRMLEKEGREAEDPDDAEGTSSVLDETLYSMMSDFATMREVGKQLIDARAGKTKPPKRMTREDWIKSLEKEIGQAQQGFNDTANTLLDQWDKPAVTAMKQEARKRVLQERFETPQQRKDKSAESEPAPSGASPPSAVGTSAVEPFDSEKAIVDITRRIIEAANHVNTFADLVRNDASNADLLNAFKENIGSHVTGADIDRVSATARGASLQLLMPGPDGEPIKSTLSGAKLADAIREAVKAPETGPSDSGAIAIDNVSSRRTQGTETTFGKYKGYASTNEGGRLSVDAYGETAAEAQKAAVDKLKKEFAERSAKRGEKPEPVDLGEPPTWAQVLNVLPKDENGDTDIDAGVRLMKEIGGNKVRKFSDLTPTQQHEMRRRARAMSEGEGDSVDALKDKLTVFASGMSRIGDLSTGTHTWGGFKSRGIGVDVGELSKPAINALARGVVDHKAQIFVDSGAFSYFRRQIRDLAAVEKEHSDLFGDKDRAPKQFKALDFDEILKSYDEITEAIGKYNEAEEAAPKPLLVMPDIVGDQQASLDLIEKYKDWIAAEAKFDVSRPIVPIQKGEYSLYGAYRRAVEILGTDRFIVGVPSNEKAVTDKELREFLNDARPTRVHFLGAASSKNLAPKLQAIADAGLKMEHLSADANILRSALYGKPIEDGGRQQAVRDTLWDHGKEEGEQLVGIDEETRKQIEQIKHQAKFAAGKRVPSTMLPGKQKDALLAQYRAEEMAKRQPEIDRLLRKAQSRAGMQAAEQKPKKRGVGIDPDRKLRDDWGVGSIDGYAETPEFTGQQTDYGVKGGVKDAFLKDASNYLKSVAVELEERGLKAAEQRNGKSKAVSINEAGPATSGDVYLDMITPDGAFLHVQIGEGFGGFQQTSSGIQVMYRAGAKQYGVEGQNRWAPTGLTAGEMAQMLHAEAEDADARILRKKGQEPHTPTEADHGNSLDLHGSDAAAGAEDVQPAQPERGVEQIHGHEGDGSEPSVQGTDEGRPEAPERLPETALGEGSRGKGDRGDGAVSGPGDDAKGRSERPGERASDRVVGENYRIEPGALEEDRGWMQKARDNVAALELAKQIETEERPATAAEQRILAKYVGWGGLKSAFPDSQGKFGKGLEKVGARVRELLSDDEYKTAQRSMQYAHYTAEHVVRSIWKGIERLAGDHQINDVFEPGMGVGNFAGLMPADLHAAYHGIEMDGPTARIAKLLYPKFGVRQADYTRIAVPENSVDLVIGNPPFADTVIKTDPKYAKQGFFLHDYFFAKSLDAVRPGGVLAFISSAGTMNKVDPKGRDYLADRADLVGAVRLNSKAFKENAGTEVTTDIIFLRKRFPGEAEGDRSWTEAVEVTLPGKDGKPVTGTNNRYFAEHPEMVLGEEGFFDKLYEGRYAVRPRPGQDLVKDLAAAMERLPAGVMKPDAAQEGPSSVDFQSTEKKDGTYYFGPKGELHQMRGGAGVPVARRGAGVEGGLTTAAVERIKGLIPVRDALREVIAANLADDAKAGDAARARLNKHYDAFVGRFGPINKAEFQSRRPTVIQQENARAEAREEARYAGLPFDEGSFDPSKLLDRRATLSEMAKARKEAKEKALAAGKPWSEGDFDPDEMPDVVIEKRPNIEPFMDDQESYRLRAIEHYDDASHKAEKGAIFSENIITRERKPEINSAADALLYSLSQFGRVNMPEIARLAGKSIDEALEELGETIYREPGTHEAFVTKDEYLSGDVRKKLVQAKTAAEQDPTFRRNVEALEAAQPTPLAPSQIRATLGMPWIPPETVEQFGRDLGLESLKVRYVPGLAQWFASGDTDSAAAMSTWGTDKRRAPALINDLLNRLPIKLYDEVKDAAGNKTRVLNVEATEAAQQKAQAIREKFESWIWSDPDRTEQLSGKYNEEKNNLVSREYDGSYLTTPGVASHWGWRPHQKRVVARIIQSGNTYMAHAVGAGKTSAMIGAGMEMRRLGLVKKPMYAVPNHMLAQFTKEFYEQYPTAKIAVADERRFHTDRRKQFIANVANEDLDAVIITHSAFGIIPVSSEFADSVVEDELQKYRDMLADIPPGPDNRITRSRIEKQIERLEQRLTGRGTSRKDQVFTFEEMGVDFLFVDEAHMFRKLDFATQMGSVKGINPEGSNMAWDLYVKSLYLDSIRPGRNLVLASGTPVTNTMAELYSLSRYLQRDLLAERGMEHFDAWASSHGEPVTELEQDAAGGYKPVTRFARFVNVPELSNMVRQVMDVVTSKQLEQYVTRPKLKGGKRIMRLAEKSPALAEYQAHLAERMEAIRRRKGPPQKGDDIMLSVINDGRHAAIDMRLVGAKSDPNSKLNLLVNDVYDIWKATKNQPFYRVKDGKYEDKPFMHGPATQLIFANLGLSGTRGFAVPDYIRSELVRRGVPKNEVQFIYDYKTSVQKQKLFNDMNSGKVRVMIGSTAKMATGVNVQPRLAAIHNLDPLWYPADDEQRNGRGIRQGNMNPEIEIRDYSTKGTYDSVMWGLMEKKARFIQGFFEGDPSLRDMDDLGEASQYEQAKAITTNDPRLIKLTELKQDLEKANRRWAAFDQELHALRSRRAGARSEIAYMTRRIADTKKDIADRVDTKGDKFIAALGPKKFEKRAEFGEALIAKLKDLRVKENANKSFKLGSVAGFPIKAQILKYGGAEDEYYNLIYLELNGGIERRVKGDSETGLVRSMENVAHGLESDLVEYERGKAKQEKFLAESEEASKAVFTGQDNIDKLTHQVRELEAELAHTDTQPHPPEVDPETINSLDSLSVLANYGSMNELQPYSPRLGQFAASAAPQEAPQSFLGQPSRGLSDEAEAHRLQDAQAQRKVREQIPGTPEHEAAQQRVKIRKIAMAWLDHWTGGRFSTGEFKLFTHDMINAPLAVGGYGNTKMIGTIGGLYDPVDMAVYIAMSDPSFPNVFRTLAHEGGLHLALDHFATPQEWAVLRSPREQRRMAEMIAAKRGLSVDDVLKWDPYEIDANAGEFYFDDLARGGKGNGFHAVIRRIFDKILNFFRALGNYLRNHGFDTKDWIFDRAFSGEMGKRESRINDLGEPSRILSEIRGGRENQAAQAAPAEVPQTETPQFKRWFGDSKVVDENGEPKVVYHGTSDSFSTFAETNDIGFHFGTVDQANHRTGAWQGFENQNVMPVYLRIENPLRLPDLGTWDPDRVIDELEGTGVLSPSVAELARGEATEIDRAFVRDALKAKGYDGIVYLNRGERTGDPESDDVSDIPSDLSGDEQFRRQYGAEDSYIAFDPTQIKSATGNNGAFTPDNPDIAMRRRAAGPGSPKRSRNSRIRDAIDRMLETRLGRKTVENFIDLNEPVKHLQNELIDRKDGAALPDTQDFHARKQLYPGRVAAETQGFNKSYLDPMVEFMRKRGISLDEAANYVEAKHVQERNAYIGKMYPAGHQFNKAMSDKKVIGGSGRSQEWADNVIRDAARRNKTRDFEKVAEFIQGIRHYVLNKLVTGHLLTPEEAREWRDRYKHYVDLRGFEDNPDDKPSDYREPAQFNVRGKEAQMATGRTSVANNPIVNMLDQAYRAIERVEKNRYLHAAWNAFGKANAEKPGSVSDIVKFDHSKPTKVIDKTTGMVREVHNNAFVMSPNAVAVKINGITHHMVFEDREIAEAVKRMRPDEVVPFFRGVLRLENKLKAMWTHWSPDFLARHFLARYPIEGAMNSFEQKENGKHSVLKYLKDSYPFVGAAYKAIRAEEAGEKPSGNIDVDLYRTYWREMKQHGGSMAFRQMRDVDLIREHLQHELKALQGSTLSNAVYRHEQFVKAMDGVTNAMDNALRLSAYASARKQGKSEQQAAVIARQATIDFMQKGKLASKVGIFFPFGNVAVNTGSRMAKAAYRSKMMRRAIFGMAMAGFTLAMWNYLIGGSDEHGNPYFEMIPPYDREKNFIWLNPIEHDEKGRPQVYKIPNQFNYSLPMNIGYAIATRMFGKEGWAETLGSVAKTAVTAFTPLGEEGNLAALPAPEVFRPAVHIWTNKNSFGNPIHNDEAFNRGPNAYSGRKDKDGQVRTGEGWKWFAEALNNLSGGDIRHSGYVDVYPESIREAFNYAGQAQGGLFQHMYETLYNAPVNKGQMAEPTQVPIERVFRGNDYDAHDRYERGHRQFLNKHPWLK